MRYLLCLSVAYPLTNVCIYHLPTDKLLRLQADDNQSGDLPLLIYGHSLSWEDSRDRVTVVNNRLRAPVWTPSVATAEDIAEMPPDPTGT